MARCRPEDCNLETETLDAVKEMYDLLGIRGYDREKLSIYYNDWYNKIEEIKL